MIRPIEQLRKLLGEASRVAPRDVRAFRQHFDRTHREALADVREGEGRELWEIACRVDDAWPEIPRRGPIRPFAPDLPPRVREALIHHLMKGSPPNAETDLADL